MVHERQVEHWHPHLSFARHLGSHKPIRPNVGFIDEEEQWEDDDGDSIL
jgi:hypothetical protein